MLADFLAIFTRISGFFLISPLFSSRRIPLALRFGLAVAFTLALAPTFLATHTPTPYPSSLLPLNLVKELMIGYLLGFIFALLVEGAALAGQMVGTLSGFSATELLSPLTASYPLFGRVFVLFLLTLLLALDLHHPFLITLYQSFTFFPVAPFPINETLTTDLVKGTALLFQQAFMYASIPFIMLFLLLVLFAIVAKTLPNFPIFWVGFPIQLWIGISAIILAVGYYSEILHHVVIELINLSRRILIDLTASV